MGEKACKKCGEIKPLDEFYSQEKHSKKKGSYTYYRPDCKDCTKNSFKEWKNNNEERFYEGQRRRDKNPPPSKVKIMRENSKRQRDNGYYKQWQQENKSKLSQYNHFRQMHKLHKISDNEWGQCKNYFNNSCAYCGMSFEEHCKEYNQDLHKEHVDHEGSNGIDNCVPACKPCNSSKWKHDLDEWFNHKNPIFSIKKYSKIQKWIKEDYKNLR